MTTTCELSKQIVGPFNQTLFLGGSVIDFSSNLGWGADSSTLTVTIAEDFSSHPQGNRLQNSFYEKLKQLSENNDNLFDSNLGSDQETDRTQYSKIGNKTSDGKMVTEDPYKNAHISLIKDIEKKENDREQENQNPNTEDLGKAFYRPEEDKKLWWLDEDPGFLASDNNAFTYKEVLKSKRTGEPKQGPYEILGVPVLFRYGENFKFGGIVTSWNRSVGQDGVKYKIEVKNFSNILSNTQLIIGHYAGSISNQVLNTSNNYIQKNLSTPGLFTGIYKIPPSEGNLPNVINIYGFLESANFGNAYETENGIPAYKIYDALNFLLNSQEINTINSNHWNPYGGLVARSISFDKNGVFNIPKTKAELVRSGLGGYLTLEDMGIIPHVSSEDGMERPIFKIDFSEVPRPPSWLRISSPTISLLDFITQICNGAGFDFFVDFIPNLTRDTKFSGIIKIRTVSRRYQPKQNVIDEYIKTLESQDIFVTQKTYGKEYNDAFSRTMYIGAKQKRLLQCRSHRFTWNQKTFAYDAFAKGGTGGFVNVPNNKNFYNTVRRPESASYRSQNFIKNGVAVFDYQNLPFDELQGPLFESIEVSKRLNFSNQGNESILTSMVHPGIARNFDYQSYPVSKRGNYQDSLHIESSNPTTITDGTMSTHTSIPIHHDVVSPYFGKHYDGTIRKVYYDPNMGQMQILFRIQDLIVAGIDISFTEELSIGVTHFVVLENELRAAGAGFDQWLSYCFDNGFFTDIEKLVYRALFRKYGNSSNVDIGSTHKGFVDSLKNGSFPNNFAQFSYSNASIFVDGLYETLNAIYQIFYKIASTYYGKSYMVSVPSLKTYRDLSTSSDIIIGNDFNGQPIYAIEGNGKLYTDYEISSEGAWEEAGNFIDDCIVVGSVSSSALVDDKNMIQPILGFNSSISRDARSNTFWQSFYNKTLKIDNPFWISSQMLKFAAVPSDTYQSLLSDVSASEYVDIQINNRTAVDGAGYSIGPVLNKTYIKVNIENNFEFLVDAGVAYPKVVLNLPSPVYLNSTTRTSNNLLTNILHDSLARYTESSSIPLSDRLERKPCLPPEVVKSNGADIASQYLYQLGKFNFAKMSSLIGTQTSIGGLSPKIDIDEYLTLNTIFPKRAAVLPRILPAEDIIKLVSNAIEINFLLSLGPGLNPIFPFSNPGAVASSYNNAQILPKAAIPTFAAVPVQLNQAVYGPWINYPGLIAQNIFNDYNKPEAIKRTNNLISGTKLEVQPQLCPWEFGSMAALDKQVMLQTGDDVNYQQLLENGTIDLPIFPDINLGSFLDNSGPLLTQVSANVGANGVSTTIGFKTYTRKLSLFNKENADRIKAISLESIKRNREIIAKFNELRDRIKNAEVGSSTSLTDITNNLPKMLRWSPSEILVGANSVVVNKTSAIKSIHTELNYNPSYMMKPYHSGNISFAYDKSIKQTAAVTLQDFRESPRELMDNYNQKSLMSLDGIISPVSLYPTPHSTTFHFTKYDTRFCPICKGTKRYTYNYADLGMSGKQPGKGSNSINNASQRQSLICDFCEEKNSETSSILEKEADPPYILTNRSDKDILEEFVQTSVSNISYKTYNPIILETGEFSISGARQKQDKSAHCINTVGYGSIPPNEYGDGLRSNASTYIEDAYSDIDRKLSEFDGITLSNNHRFFGLRGPLIVHSWGYDTDGFPVPNRADQPVMNGQAPVRKSDGTILTIGEDPSDDTVFNREKTFYNGWAQLPGTWPVGPIDLRWDRDKKMWTVGDREKYAFIILEEDLTDIQPIRGALWDNSIINNKPLPNGYRKLVFVKDNKGITAPRGAKIYCRYSNKNGFYEPIYANAFMASGTINGGNSATIYSAYSQSNTNLSDNPLALSEYNTTFQNPLNFSISNGSIGIFVFINGSWVLQSQNSCG